jgi:hypothetical protein
LVLVKCCMIFLPGTNRLSHATRGTTDAYKPPSQHSGMLELNYLPPKRDLATDERR